MTFLFEWDSAKADLNFRKHGVSFLEARTVLYDHAAITLFDEEHSDDEDRYIDIGRSIAGRILVVVYTARGDRIRIISSRQANRDERREYERRSARRHN